MKRLLPRHLAAQNPSSKSAVLLSFLRAVPEIRYFMLV